MNKSQRKNKAYKALLRDLERQENMTQNKDHNVENQTKSLQQDKKQNYQELQLKSAKQNRTGFVADKSSKEEKQKFPKANKSIVNDAVDITDLQQASKQALARDFDKLNKEKNTQSKVFEPHSYIIKISNETLKEKIRNSTKPTLPETLKLNTNIRPEVITSTIAKHGKKQSLQKNPNKDKPRIGLVNKKTSETEAKKQHVKSMIKYDKFHNQTSVQQSHENEESLQVPTIVTSGNITNTSIAYKLNKNYNHQKHQDHKFVESSANRHFHHNNATNDINTPRSTTVTNIDDKMQNKAMQDNTTRDENLAKGQQNGSTKVTKANELAKQGKIVDQDTQGDTTSVDKTSSISRQNPVNIKTDKTNSREQFSKNKVFIHKDINFDNTTNKAHAENREGIPDKKKSESSTDRESPMTEETDEDGGSGEASKSETISLQELTRSVRNIKDKNTRKALTKALVKDEQKIQKLANEIMADRKKNKQSFSLSRVLRDLVTRPDLIPDELDDKDDIFERRVPGSNKALLRVKRVKLDATNLRQTGIQSEKSLTRVKRVDGDLFSDDKSDSEKTLIRVKRKEIDERHIANNSTPTRKDGSIHQRKSISRNSEPPLQTDQGQTTQNVNINKIGNDNNASLYESKLHAGQSATKTHDLDLDKQKQPNIVQESSIQTPQDSANQKLNQNIPKSYTSELKAVTPQSSRVEINHNRINSKYDLHSRNAVQDSDKELTRVKRG